MEGLKQKPLQCLKSGSPYQRKRKAPGQARGICLQALPISYLCLQAFFVLVISKDKGTRFHAYQSVFLGIGELVFLGIVALILPFTTGQAFFVGFDIWIIILTILNIVLLYFTYKGRTIKIPIAGQMAEKRA